MDTPCASATSACAEVHMHTTYMLGHMLGQKNKDRAISLDACGYGLVTTSDSMTGKMKEKRPAAGSVLPFILKGTAANRLLQ